MILTLLTILQTLFATIEGNTLQSDLKLTLQQPQQQPITYIGHITMHGEQFVGEIMQMNIAYDGKTLYNYSDETNELTLSTPTQPELYAANPFLFAKAMAEACTVTETPNGKSTRVTLIPQDVTTGIKSIILNIATDAQLPYPISIVVSEEAQGGIQTTTLKFTNAAYINTPTDFTITAPDGAYVNDIRL